jgi:hypothetical protein
VMRRCGSRLFAYVTLDRETDCLRATAIGTA